MLFRGAPGTGKTTVARLLAKIFKAMGILSKGHLVEKDRAGLVGQHVGETAPKVAAVVKEALGGILFIDEAYSLNSKDSYGAEAINTLLTRMEEHRSDLVVIAAGYDKEMDKFLASNSGLASRFTHSIQFDDYTPQQLGEIFNNIVSANKIQLTQPAHTKLAKVLQQMHSQRGAAFGNGRDVRNLFERAYQNMGARRAINLMDAVDISL
jgi:SpoVK/Ycf46/Vps4 family AAA+-type ATPase